MSIHFCRNLAKYRWTWVFMGEPAFTCIKAIFVDNVGRRVNKGSDVP